MQDADLLVQLAGIAGVFVGFGALIGVRSGGASGAEEVSGIRWVVSNAIWVVAAALAPVTLGRYDIAGHELWLACSLLAIVIFFVVWAMNLRTAEFQGATASYSRGQNVRSMAVNSLLFVPMMGALVLVVLGLFPDQESALYLTAAVLGLFLTAVTLLDLVFTQRRPQTA